jgi:hypothetical protein
VALDRAPEPPGPEVNAAMAELVTYALACDLTRVFTYQWSRVAAHLYFKNLGFSDSYHAAVHYKQQAQMTAAILYTMRELAVLVERMKNTPDGAGNLLDNSCVFVTSELSDGSAHSCRDFPVLLLGKAGGALRGDTHYRSTTQESTHKVHLTLMQIFHPPTTSFGFDTNGCGVVTDGIAAIRT